MIQYLLKLGFTVGMVVLITEAAKRSSFMGALFASVPLTSLLALILLYKESQDVSQVSAFSWQIFWLVLPSLILFVALPLLLKQGLHFYLSLGISLLLTVLSYGAMTLFLSGAK